MANSGCATPQPLIEGVDYGTPCVYANKMREFSPNERFDRWCIKHHHWLNEKPAIGVVDAMVADLKGGTHG